MNETHMDEKVCHMDDSLFDDNGKKFELYEFSKHMDDNVWHMDGWNWKTLLL